MNKNEERIYKDLMYTQKAYFTGEQIFPVWESIYALIVSGLFVTYFTATSLGFLEQLILSFIGLFISFGWFCLVSRNHLYSLARRERMKELEKAIQDEILGGIEAVESDMKPFSLIQYQETYISEREKLWNKVKTWCIRKILPLLLSFIWFVLIIYTVVCWLN
ncbi:MAG: hypothetical protein ISS58_04690 [Dehalococcoidales bacterium]|nr:hypothetical protein [Dehalococcoidales bacterium]